MEKLDNTRDDWSFILKNSEELGVNEYQTFLNKGGEMAEAIKQIELTILNGGKFRATRSS